MLYWFSNFRHFKSKNQVLHEQKFKGFPSSIMTRQGRGSMLDLRGHSILGSLRYPTGGKYHLFCFIFRNSTQYCQMWQTIKGSKMRINLIARIRDTTHSTDLFIYRWSDCQVPVEGGMSRSNIPCPWTRVVVSGRWHWWCLLGAWEGCTQRWRKVSLKQEPNSC